MRNPIRFVWPVILIVAGTAVIIWAFAPIVASFGGADISIVVPGATTFTVEKPGKYTLWSEAESAFGGRLMTFPTGIPPGVTIRIARASDGSAIPLRSKWPTTRRNGPGTFRIAIGTVTFDTAGSYRIVADGLREKRALHLDQLNFDNLFASVGFAILGSFLIIAGFAWGIALFVSR